MTDGYMLGIDWADIGDPADPGEDDTADVIGDLAVSWGRDTTQAGSMPTAGQFGFTLNNTSRRYSAENSSGPLFGDVLPGRRVQLFHTLSGATVKFFDGILDSPSTDTTAKTFTGDCLDAWGRPGGESLSTALFQGIRTGDAINTVLDAIGWTGGRNIDPGATVMPFWWAEDVDAASAIQAIVDSEGPQAIAYVQAGVFVFEDRFHRLFSPASQSSQGLYTHIVPSGSGPPGDFKIARGSWTYDHGLTRIVNSVTFAVDLRRTGARGEVWSSDDPLFIGSGNTAVIFVQATDPFMGAATPDTTPGGGITISSGSVTASLSRSSGQSTILTLTAAADTQVVRLALTATPVPVGKTVKITAEDISSVGAFGRKSWPGSLPFANVYDAQAIADRIVATYAINRPVISFSIQGLDLSYMAQIRGRQLSDRVTVRNDEQGLNADFMIEKVEHRITKLVTGANAVHTMTLTCEVPPPMQPANVFLFDVAGCGFDDGRFGVSGIDNPANVFLFDVAGQGFDQGVFGT